MDVVQQTPHKRVENRDSLACLFQAAGKKPLCHHPAFLWRMGSKLKCLGITIDSALTFSNPVSSLVRTCYFQLRQLRSIKKSLTVDTCHALVKSLIISRLDYCNGVLTGAPADLPNRLDGVLRGAARFDFETSAFRSYQRFDAQTVALARHQIANWIQDVSHCPPLPE